MEPKWMVFETIQGDLIYTGGLTELEVQRTTEGDPVYLVTTVTGAIHQVSPLQGKIIEVSLRAYAMQELERRKAELLKTDAPTPPDSAQPAS